MRVPSTQVQNNFGKYLKYAEAGEEIIVTRKGKDIAKIVASPVYGEETLREEAANYSPSTGKVTYEEFLELTEASEQRYELIDGVLYNLASPSYKHQHAVHEIHGTFYNWFKGKPCKPLTSPFDITITKTSDNICVVQPDLFVLCDTTNVDEKGKYRGVPVLVVEVLSPATRNKDMLKKLDLYRECGVREYWIVDPIHEQIQVYAFEDNDIADSLSYSRNADSPVKSFYFEGLTVEMQNLFE